MTFNRQPCREMCNCAIINYDCYLKDNLLKYIRDYL